MNPYTLVSVLDKVAELLQEEAVKSKIRAMSEEGKTADEVMRWVYDEASAILARECLEGLNG